MLDTDTGECRHVPIAGRRPLVTLESVYALGLSPAEVQAQVMERVATVEAGAVARLFIDGVDPGAYRLLDLEAVREAGAAALHLKVEPSFANVQHMTELPELASMPAQWERYIAEQDLTGFDRARITGLGRDYLARAVEESAG